MKKITPLLIWLALAAMVDWIVGRTLTRMAIYMPKSSSVILVYQVLAWLGQFAAVLSGLLALGVLARIAWIEFRRRGEPAIWLSCTVLFSLSILNLVVASRGWLALGYHFCMLVVLIALTRRAWDMGSRTIEKTAGLLTGVTLIVSQIHQMIPAISSTAHLPATPGWSVALFNTGEFLVVTSVLLLWLAYGRQASGRLARVAWLGGALPVMIFIPMRIANPAMTGILAIWSTGLSLYLPWPLYALALCLAGVTVIVALQRGSPVGLALLLLAAGGYGPQLNILAFFGVAALWLLAPGEAGLFEQNLPAMRTEPDSLEAIRL